MALMHAAEQTRKQILIVDRDVAAAEPLRHRLGDAGFIVRLITDGPAAAAAVAERPPQLVILDWSIPGFAALEVIERARAMRFPHPIRLIILSALAAEQDVVGGLNAGADDYIAKPYSLLEAVARVCAVLRTRTRNEAPPVSHVPVIVPPAGSQSRSVESRLLEFLRAHPGKTFNRAELLRQVWGSAVHLDERTVDVNIQRLRKFLSRPGHEAQIETVRGSGYRFVSRGSDGASQF
jgi:two-component system, OmpR family, phosphate regulon response regulator PhoB